MLHICQESVNQIQGLAAKSLDLVRLSCEPNRPQLEPLFLADIAHSAIGELAASFSKRGVSCLNRIDAGLQVMGAAGQLLLLFKNLLSNAARYAAQNGTVCIRAGLLDGSIRVSV